MSILGNIVWLVFGGLLASLGYFLMGLLLCVTIVGFPFGIAAIHLARSTLTPFGKEPVMRRDAWGVLRVLFNLLWLVLAGWEIALTHLVSAAILAVTVIGIPFALQHLKLLPMSLMPFAFALVEVDEPQAPK